GIDSANTKDTEDLCSATQIFKNWDKAIQDSVKDQTAYLKNVQNYFDPRANDIGIAMSLNSKRNTYVQTEVRVAEAQRTEDQGAVRNTNAGGKLLELPGNFALNLENVKFLQSSALMSQTGDAFIDAANVFVSVLSNKLYDKAMERLMKLLADQDDDTKTANTKLFDFYSSANVGQAESEALLAPITDMAFTSGHDIDLLNNLASCPDPNKPGAMNCVVNNNFVQAISQELTIGQALKKKLLNGNANFGSDKLTSTNLETGDINWRSMKILRKYRILPVSWEVAAEMINTNGYNQGKAITIADMIGCYNDKDEYDTGYNVEWCKGLIDPNWPLKAPRSYCAKSGFGNQVDYMDILSEDQAATGTSPAVLSTVNLLRTSNYCADEQSCIKEGANNSCELYGYCTEDRRTWKFPSNTCDANYNTCQTYTNTAGQKTSYLANTLNFSSCNADNSGCAGYCTKYDYANSVFTCAPNTTTDKYYLSGKVEDCSASEAGCQQLIRLKDNSGVNLLFNGDFEFSTVGATNNTDGKLDNWNFYSTMGGSITVVSSSDKVYAGNKALKLQPIGSGGLVSSDWSTPNQSSLPKNFLMRPGVSYTLSAYIYNNDSSPVKLAIGNSLSTTSWTETETTQTQTWEKVSVTINNDEYYNANSFKIYKAGSGTFYLDNIMFEIASQGNQGYKKYREAAYTYEKLIPKDLDTLCYEQIGTGRRLKANAPAECRNYARTCLPQEADCKLFTNKNTGDNIPAKINLQNYCPSSCVNFASFWQEPTNFNIGQEKSLIPDKAVTCSSANVGCNEFTNLSTDANAETKEYYSYLRQCVKPDEANANCAEFYTWENNENTGLQLSSHTLRAETNGAPKLTEASVRPCTAASLDINSGDYNPDCREVRNQAGEIFYVPYSKTITCSANCQTYRLSENNVVTNITSAASCNLINGNWISNRAECVVCKNGGTWDETHQRCLYKGLPTESSSCSASQNGCRRYSGTGSANWRLVTSFSFDNNSTENWDNASVQADTFRNNGSSISTLSNYSEVSLDNLGIEKGKKYRLQFFAKPQSSNATINSISIYDTTNSSVLSTLSPTITLNSGWNFYTVAASSTIDVNTPTSGIVLRFNHSSNYFLDEIRLIEVNDEYYLLKDSLNVPIECNRDYNGTPSPGFMLGC
ncbi:MAG TPA: carbohydrate binding domain-containing protein, partial [bacterium]|nr:carbohydrate binding domain-containing protein [bacterium]